MQVALVQQNDGPDALVQGHHGHLVNKVGIGDRRRLRAQDHQLVDVGDGGTNESVAPGQPLQNIAPRAGDPKGDILPRRENAVAAQLRAGPAAQDLIPAGHVIIAANSLDDDARSFFFHQNVTTSEE